MAQPAPTKGVAVKIVDDTPLFREEAQGDLVYDGYFTLPASIEILETRDKFCGGVLRKAGKFFMNGRTQWVLMRDVERYIPPTAPARMRPHLHLV